MAGHFKNFVAILMAVLALGIWTPQSACAAATPAAEKTCGCCSESAMPASQPDKDCNPSCALTQVQAADKQLPARSAPGTSLYGGPLLLPVVPVTIQYPAFVPVARQRDLNVSPPFGGSPPQAILRLWLI